MKKVALSACLAGKNCRYDGKDNLNQEILDRLKYDEITLFCPEDAIFGSPRPTMDLVLKDGKKRAISNDNNEDISIPIEQYAYKFFEYHKEIELFVGKDRSPSCGVKSARVYDVDKKMMTSSSSGLMADEARQRGIESLDAEDFIKDKM